MLSLAHRRSRSVIIDPVYAAGRVAPARPARGAQPWFYGRGELEAHRFSLIRMRGHRDCQKVFHPGLFQRAQHLSWFRVSVDRDALPSSLDLTVIGGFVLKINGRAIERRAENGPDPLRIPLLGQAGTNRIDLTIFGMAEPGCLRCPGLAGWEWSADGCHWSPAAVHAAGDGGQPPHRDELVEVALAPLEIAAGVADFGRELLARPILRGRAPRLVVGESLAEALCDDPAHHEQRLDLVPHGRGTWIAAAPLALRYARAVGGTVSGALASFHPVRYRGAFACSDERLNAIWMRSAYTLRLCLHDFLVDGIKRDRMPWVGDFALALLGNAYCFHDREIVCRSLVALGGERVDECMLNAIIDYSLWWVISLDLYATHFGDRETVAAEGPRLRRLLAVMDARCDARGYLIPRAGDWLFIDWVSFSRTGAVTALQCVWVWALDAAARVLEDPALARRAEALRRRLRREGWTGSAYRESIDDPASGPSRHACAFAVLAGVATARQKPALTRLLQGTEAPPAGTPYAEAFCAQAQARLGSVDGLLGRIRTVWGGMLDQGATTFWEAYDPAHQGDQHAAFYGRPFGKSLCHAWAAGPAVLLPAEVLGIRPSVAGWQVFSVEPQLGDLSWAAACVPTPFGDIEVEVAEGWLHLVVPAGTVAEVAGRRLPGGTRHRLRLAKPR